MARSRSASVRRNFTSAKTTSPGAREYRGLVTQQENGVSIVVSRRRTLTGSFNYLNRVASFENNFWVGHVTRTAPESAAGTRVTRLTYEYIGRDPKTVLPAARQAGFTDIDALMPYHRRLLQPDAPFN